MWGRRNAIYNYANASKIHKTKTKNRAKRFCLKINRPKKFSWEQSDFFSKLLKLGRLESKKNVGSELMKL